eukprot:2467536-Rhodomonas_salina.2
MLPHVATAGTVTVWQVSVRPSRALAAGAANLKSLLEVTWCADHSCRQSEELGEVQAAGGGYRAWTGWVRVWMLRPPELQKEAVTIMSGSWGAAGRVCGDFFVEGEEGCDDGNTEEGDGCSSACQVPPLLSSSAFAVLCAGLKSVIAPRLRRASAAGQEGRHRVGWRLARSARGKRARCAGRPACSSPSALMCCGPVQLLIFLLLRVAVEHSTRVDVEADR